MPTVEAVELVIRMTKGEGEIPDMTGLKAAGPLLTALGGGQAGLNAFGADYAARPKFWKD